MQVLATYCRAKEQRKHGLCWAGAHLEQSGAVACQLEAVASSAASEHGGALMNLLECQPK